MPSELSLMICTPAYGGQVAMRYTKSLLALQTHLMQAGHAAQFSYLEGVSLLPLARNLLVDMFLRSPHSHMLFIDADLEFRPEDVMRMLHFADRDVVAGIYPKKEFNWHNVAEALRKRDETGVLGALTGSFAGIVQFKDDTERFESIDQPIEVLAAPTGLMLIARATFERLIADGCPSAFVGRDADAAEPQLRHHVFFETEIDAAGRYTSEDYSFCRKVIAGGGRIFACPWFVTAHIGSFPYVGDLRRLIEAGVSFR